MTYRSMELVDQFDAMHCTLHSGGPAFTALGACIFAGGFSLGMEEAGFDVVGHLELPDLALGSKVSMQRWPVAVTDLGGWKSFIDSIMDVKPDVFYANPPCVAYASSGNHKGASDERMCYTRYCAYEAALQLQPSVWTWELVPGIFGKERGFLDAMAFRARRFGYRCYAFLTSSAIHGGFQDRRRFHFVASKYDLDFEGMYEREPPERKGVKMLGECLDQVDAARYELAVHSPGGPETRLGLLPNDESLYKGAFNAIIPFCPPGEHLRDVPTSVMKAHYRPRGIVWNGKSLPGFNHTRGRLDRPSPNVLGGHTVVHPIENRYLTPRECATIMGFPMDYAFSPGSKAYAEIGRGLCTHNAAFLGRVIHDGLSRNIRTVPHQQSDGSYLTVVDWRRRAKKLSLRMTTEEQTKWWTENHPQLPVPDDLGVKR